MFARADADEDGVLTEAELPPTLWERLSAADTDEDGKLTLDELTSFTPERGPHGPPHAGPGEGDALERFDQNDDGALTEDELPEKLWVHIAPADADGDGSISAEELAAYRPEPPPREDPFDCLDKDENGVLTEDELPQQVWDRLAGADIDGDGSISPEELAAYRPEPPPREDFFARLDKDDDGLLIENELPPQLWERLSGADANGDGSITPTELADASLALVPHERGPAPHRGGGPRPMMPFGGNARRF